MTDAPPPAWPSGVEPIGIEDLNRLGIDGTHQIYWDGRLIEIRKSIVLTRFQKWVTVLVTIVGLLAGVATFLNSGAIFLCARHISILSCPAP